MDQLKNSSTKIVDLPKDQRTKTQKRLSFLTWTCGLSLILVPILFGPTVETWSNFQNALYALLWTGFPVLLIARFVFND